MPRGTASSSSSTSLSVVTRGTVGILLARPFRQRATEHKGSPKAAHVCTITKVCLVILDQDIYQYIAVAGAGMGTGTGTGTATIAAEGNPKMGAAEGDTCCSASSKREEVEGNTFRIGQGMLDVWTEVIRAVANRPAQPW